MVWVVPTKLFYEKFHYTKISRFTVCMCMLHFSTKCPLLITSVIVSTIQYILCEVLSTFLRAGGVKISSMRDSIGDKGRGERLTGRRERLEA